MKAAPKHCAQHQIAQGPPPAGSKKEGQEDEEESVTAVQTAPAKRKRSRDGDDKNKAKDVSGKEEEFIYYVKFHGWKDSWNQWVEKQNVKLMVCAFLI